MTLDLFHNDDDDAPAASAPLAERMRPRALDELVGQEHLTGEGKLLARSGGMPPSMIFWGPPGSGKTTLARLLAARANARFTALSAVSVGVKEVRGVIAEAKRLRRSGQRTILFLDEIHRFNKAQQDSLLPVVESGLLTLFGATTENPSFEVNAALLSRCRVVVLRALEKDALRRILERALTDVERGLGSRSIRLDPVAAEALLDGADGDARRMLGAIEVAVQLVAAGGEESTPVVLGAAAIQEALQAPTLRYDREGEEHYNLISALHKSVRASDPQGAVYWTERMLASGEDPLYVARRLVRMAVEDIGLADPQGIVQAMAAQQAVHFLGMPEGGAALVQAAIYLALAPKSNRVYAAENAVKEEIARSGSLPVPLHFRNAPTALMKNLGYARGHRYDHDAPDAFTGQSGLPDALEGREFYHPSGRGFEADLERRLASRGRRRDPPEEGPAEDEVPEP